MKEATLIWTILLYVSKRVLTQVAHRGLTKGGSSTFFCVATRTIYAVWLYPLRLQVATK